MGSGGWALLGALVGVGLDWLSGQLPAWLWPTCPARRPYGRQLRLAAIFGLALTWGLIWARPQPPLNPALLTLWSSALLLLALIDLQFHLLPFILILPTTGVLLAGRFAQAFDAGVWSVLGALSGFLFVLGVYGVARLAYRAAALGWGDVLLTLLIGAMTGPVRLWPALAAGMLVGGGAAWLWRRRGAAARTTLPYGACLCLGAWLVEMWAWCGPGR